MNFKKFELNLGIGVKINIGDFKDGIKYEYKREKKKHEVTLYAELSTLKTDIYAYVEFKIPIKIKKINIPLVVRVDLVKELFEGFKETIYEITPKNITLFISVLSSKFIFLV